MRSPASSDCAVNRLRTDARGVELLGRIVDMREDNLPRRLAMNADGLDALEDGLPAALEHVESRFYAML